MTEKKAGGTNPSTAEAKSADREAWRKSKRVRQREAARKSPSSDAEGKKVNGGKNFTGEVKEVKEVKESKVLETKVRENQEEVENRE